VLKENILERPTLGTVFNFTSTVKTHWNKILRDTGLQFVKAECCELLVLVHGREKNTYMLHACDKTKLAI